MLLLDKLGEFLGEQSQNYRILLIRSVVAGFLDQLAMNFNSLFIVELGATPFQLSSVRAVGSAVSALVSLPVGWLSDVYSLKKIMIIGMAIQVLSIAFYAFAQDWRWIILAIISATLTMTLVFRTQNIFIANSLSRTNRSMGYAMRTTIMQFFSIFAPTIGGVLVFYFGGISVEGIRPLYYIQLVGFLIISAYVTLNLRDVETEKDPEPQNFIEQYKKMFRAGSYLKRFVFLEALGSITWGLSMPFPFIYAVEFKGADSLIIGYMGTFMTLTSMLLAIPLGNLADTRGRKFVIFATRPFYYASFLLLVFAPPGVHWVLLLAWGMRGVMMASSAWMTMSIEMVPREFRGRWTGFKGLFQNLIRVVAMLLGGYLYESVNPVLVFLIPLVVDLLVRMPVLATVPDTLKGKH
jgi:MFS family permease